MKEKTFKSKWTNYITTRGKRNLLEFHWIRKLNYFSIKQSFFFRLGFSFNCWNYPFCRRHSRTFLHRFILSESLLFAVIWLILHSASRLPFIDIFHPFQMPSFNFLNNMKNDIKYLYLQFLSSISLNINFSSRSPFIVIETYFYSPHFQVSLQYLHRIVRKRNHREQWRMKTHYTICGNKCFSYISSSFVSRRNWRHDNKMYYLCK